MVMVLFVLLSIKTSYAQGHLVSGTIFAEGEGLPGANVIVKGTSLGTITDIEGKFSLDVPSPNDILVISFVGYENAEIPIDSRKEISVTLYYNPSLLQEMVVVGYGEQKKELATGSISTVEPKNLESFSISRVDQNLGAITSSVNVQTPSASPGSAINLYVRGYGTNGDARPLLVIDGVPVEDGNLGYINPADIEGISILKDAASIGIYGARGANGVILVKTRGGQKGKHFRFFANSGVQTAWKVPEVLTRDQYIELQNSIPGNSGVTKSINEVLMEDSANNRVTNTDWMDLLFESANVSNIGFSFSSADENSSIFTSFARFRQEGIIAPEKSNFERYNMRLNTEVKPTKFLTFGEKLSVTHARRSYIQENNYFSSVLADALNIDPLTPLYDPALNDSTTYGFAQSKIVTNDYVNPLARLHIYENKNFDNNVVGKVYGEVNFLKNFRFHSEVGIDYFNQRFELFTYPHHLSPNTQNDNSSLQRVNVERFVLNLENYINFSRDFGDHSFDVVLGTSYRERNLKYMAVVGQGSVPQDNLNNPNLWTLDPTKEDGVTGNIMTPVPAFPALEDYMIYGYFGRVNYDYRDKYLLSLVGRQDASSRFGSEKSGFFPSASVGWVISEEPFFTSNPFVNFLKVKSSYGVNGNDRIGELAYASLVTSRNYKGYPLGSSYVPGVATDEAANPDVRWETSLTLDLGVEATLFKGLLNLDVSYYNKTTEDLLIREQGPSISGTPLTFRNLAEVVNKGWEISLGINKEFGDLTFFGAFNVSTLDNEVTKMQEGTPLQQQPEAEFPLVASGITAMEVGRPLFYFRGYETDGIFQTNAEALRYKHFEEVNGEIVGTAIQPGAVAGDIKFVDQNGDGVIDSKDMTMIGKPWADLNIGYNMTLSYRNFDVSTIISSAFGRDIFRIVNRSEPSVNKLPIWYENGFDINKKNGTPEKATLPSRNTARLDANFGKVSDIFVENGDYIRMKNLQVGYSLPKNILSKLQLSSLRVYLSMDNVFTITDYTGYDPEIGTPLDVAGNPVLSRTGIDNGFYPQARTYSAGINLEF